MTQQQQTPGHTLFVILSFSFLILLAPTSILAQDSSYFEFAGYMRSGFGIDGKGRPHDVFKAPNSEAKYRLGNEAEVYVEALFKYSFEDDQGSLFETNLSQGSICACEGSCRIYTSNGFLGGRAVL